MLKPEAESSIDAHNARRSAWIRGEKPVIDSRFGARTFGSILEITPGVEIWTCEDGRRNWHEEPLGGIVVHIDLGAPATIDDETGEVIKHPARFRCYDPMVWPLRRAFVTLDEDEINRDAITAADTASIVTAIRRFCKEIAGRHDRTLDAFDARLIQDAATLAAVAIGGR